MKKLSSDEISFIEQKLAEKNNTSVKIDDNENLIIKKIKGKRWWQRINYTPYIVGVFSILPFILSALLLYIISRFDNILGPGTLKWISLQANKEDIINIAKQNRIGWIEQVLWLYNNQYIIIGIIFSIFIILIGLTLLISYLIKNRNKSNEEEENGSEEENTDSE